jgi:hypothetical protein
MNRRSKGVTTMKYTLRYLRFALSNLAAVGFRLAAN